MKILKTLTKKDNKNCKACLSVKEIFWNNESNSYEGIVYFKENNQTLFILKTNINRLYTADALKDAEYLAQSNGF